MIKPILINADVKTIGVDSICMSKSFGLGQIIHTNKQDCFHNTHTSGGSITTPWKRNLKGDISHKNIILVDTEAEIIKGDLIYNIRESIIERVGSKDDLEFVNSINKNDELIIFKISASTNKFHKLPQLSKESIQLLINYYNDHKCMPENVKVETYTETKYKFGIDSSWEEIKLSQQGEVDLIINTNNDLLQK